MGRICVVHVAHGYGMGMGIEFVYVCFSLDSAANQHLYSLPLIDHRLSS